MNHFLQFTLKYLYNQILIRKIQRKWRKIFEVIDHNNWPLLETKKFHSVMIIYDDDIQMIWRLFCNLFVKKVNLISEISKFHSFVLITWTMYLWISKPFIKKMTKKFCCDKKYIHFIGQVQSNFLISNDWLGRLYH